MSNVAKREHMGAEREGVTKHFHILHTVGERVLGFDAYVTISFFPDGRPGELFIRAAKDGDLAHGAFDALGMAVSLGLQHGVPLRSYAEKFRGMNFEPSGMTGDPKCPFARSVLDALGRWLLADFCAVAETVPIAGAEGGRYAYFSHGCDVPTCRECGSIVLNTGLCSNCGVKSS